MLTLRLNDQENPRAGYGPLRWVQVHAPGIQDRHAYQSASIHLTLPDQVFTNRALIDELCRQLQRASDQALKGTV